MSLNPVDKSWVDTAAKRLGPPLFTTGEEVRFNCFRDQCGSSGMKDSHFHMYVNPSKGKFFCQRCQKGGTLEYLTNLLKIPLPDQNMEAWTMIVNEFLFPTKVAADNDEVPCAVPDPSSAVIMPGMRAFQYLRERGLTIQQITQYDLRLGTEKLRNRIIFPDINDTGELVYWVARDYVGREPKYKNATAPREKMIYNLGRMKSWFKRLRRVVICEGVISAIVAGYEAVATYGKYVTVAQIKRLVAADADEYIVAFDGDALEYGVSVASRLKRFGCRTRVAKFPDNKDPADLGREEARFLINDAIEFTTDFDAVRIML